MSKLIVDHAAKVLTSNVEWLVEGLIPRNHLSIIDGDPGQGKSFLSLEIVACASTGMHLTPKGRKKGARVENVLVLNSEDHRPGMTEEEAAAILGGPPDVCYSDGQVILSHGRDQESGVRNQESVKNRLFLTPDS